MGGNMKRTDHDPAYTKSTYDPTVLERAHDAMIQVQLTQRKLAISKLEDKLLGTRQMELDVMDIMDLVEEILHTCGAEAKATFLEVTTNMIRIHTRIPLHANLYPFLHEAHVENIRFHKKVTGLLMGMRAVRGVRWIPVEEGAQLIISVRWDN